MMNQVIRMSLVVICFLTSSTLTFSQSNKGVKSVDVPKGWHLLDKSKDGFNGISLSQAYEFVKSRNLKSNPVIVAVIDSGIDTLHEDLKPVLWRNPKEVPGNGKDDDGNGYADDLHGWNFLGGKDGRNVNQDSHEAGRVYHTLKLKYAGREIDTTGMAKDSIEEYKLWLRAKQRIEGENNESSALDMVLLKKAYASAERSDSILTIAMKKDTFTGNDLDTFQTANSLEKAAKGAMLYLFRANQMMTTTNKEFLEGFKDFLNSEERKAEAKTKVPPDYRKDIVQDNENDINDRFYGNSDIMAAGAYHGTHVSGIIAAARDNGKGMDGIADNVKIMMIRAVPDGDEHDKDVALAIRYAVDNGARVVNMSFGKYFSPQKKWVDEAVKYAESKNVLLVHAAGNEGTSVDSAAHYPNATFTDGTRAKNWITVGASGDEKTGGIVAPFSNYGKQEVDVFAPGVRIYSTIPGRSTYGNAQGTSMASPVVAGVAAFVLQYFPHLTVEQLKTVLEKSAQVPADTVQKPDSGEEVKLDAISKTGGIINAYEAAKLAETIQPETKGRRNKRQPKTILENQQK